MKWPSEKGEAAIQREEMLSKHTSQKTKAAAWNVSLTFDNTSDVMGLGDLLYYAP